MSNVEQKTNKSFFDKEREIEKLKAVVDNAKGDFSKTIFKLEEYLKSDKRKINNLEDDFLKLLTELTVANSKLDFLEDKIDERLITLETNIDVNKLSNEKLQMVIKNIIRTVLKNKKGVNKIILKSVGVSKEKKPNEVSEANSLSENIVLLNEKLILVNNELLLLMPKVNLLYSEHQKKRKSRAAIIKVMKKTKPIASLIYKYTLKSIITRCIIYLSVIASGSPYVYEFLKYLEKLIKGE